MNRPILAAAVCLGLSACMSVPLSSLPALSRIEFMTTDLSALRVAVRMPDAIRPKAGGAQMEALKTLEDGTKEQSVYLLIPTDEPTGEIQPALAGEATHVFRLSDADRARFEALRAGLLRHKQEGKRGSLGLGIATKEFCRQRELPSGPIPVTTYLRTSETARYVTLTDRLDLRRDDAMAKALPDLKRCDPT